MIRVIKFSGGKTSALMTILNYREGDLVIFADTKREHPKTYKFINDFEAHENIPIIRISYEGGFRGMLEHKKWKLIPGQPLLPDQQLLCGFQFLTPDSVLLNFQLQAYLTY